MMKSLFLLLAMTLTVIAPQAKADGQCTEITVTYEGGEPSQGRGINAWDATRCGDSFVSHYTEFPTSGTTKSFKNGPTVSLAFRDVDSRTWPVTLDGTSIELLCHCDYGICGDCSYVFPQGTRAKKKKPSKI